MLSEPEKVGRRWDVESFMATGVQHVDTMLDRFGAVGGTLPSDALAVDFGCGIGRLSQPLARHFGRVIGVDISPTMVSVAKRVNRFGERVQYVLNDGPDLPFLARDSVDLIHTHITLQHVPPSVTRGYLAEFLRVGKPGGGLVFQLPSHFSDSYLPADRDDRPVPPGFCRADIVFVDGPEVTTAGAELTVCVSVSNTSNGTWTQSELFPLHIGNHWLDAQSRAPVGHDDGRTRLPGRLAPGDSADLSLVVRVPATPGRYVLQVDVVQEQVRWFAESGQAPAEVEVEVAPASVPDGVDQDAAQPLWGPEIVDCISPSYFTPSMFAMHAIPRPEVERLLSDAGATLLAADEWVNEWHSFSYYVQLASH